MSGETVTRKGLIWRAGSYPDRDFSVSPAELEEVVRRFRPALLEMEHQATILDGQLGTLQRVWADGAALFGEISIPKWLDDAAGGALKVSAVFDRKAKTLQRLGIVKTPRVEDAVMFATFAAAVPGFEAVNHWSEPSTFSAGIAGQGADPNAEFGAFAESAAADVYRQRGEGVAAFDLDPNHPTNIYLQRQAEHQRRKLEEEQQQRREEDARQRLQERDAAAIRKTLGPQWEKQAQDFVAAMLLTGQVHPAEGEKTVADLVAALEQDHLQAPQSRTMLNPTGAGAAEQMMESIRKNAPWSKDWDRMQMLLRCTPLGRAALQTGGKLDAGEIYSRLNRNVRQ